MAKTIIKGRFATATDAATVHQISDARREQLDREIQTAIDAVDQMIAEKRRKTTISKRSARTVALRAKRK